MKKILFTIANIFLITCCLYAAKPIQTKRLSVQAGVDDTLYLEMVPIAAQSQAFMMGMPFNVDDELVSYGYARRGRQVASWSLLTNTPFKISVQAPDLKNVGQNSEYELPYYLCFSYSLSYYEEGNANPTPVNSAFVIKSTGNTDRKIIDVDGIQVEHSAFAGYKVMDSDSEPFTLVDNASSDGESFIGTLEGSIYFKFANAADTVNAAPGDYMATVIVTVTAEGDVSA